MLGNTTPRRQAALLAVLLVALALVPAVIGNPYLLHLFILAMIYAMLTASWNLINGYAGLFTFGHQAFFGLGAYASALLAMHLGWSPWATLWLGGVVAALAGFATGLPVLRIRSIAHVAIVTLAFAIIVQTVISNWTSLTRGSLGLGGIPAFDAFAPWPGARVAFTATDGVSYYYVGLILLALSLGGLMAVINSRTGLALKALRDSEPAADSLGVDPTRYKLAAFVISSFVAGVAGAFYAHYLHILTPDSAVGVAIMITILVATLVGGIGTIFGPVLGAFLVIFGLEGLRGLGDYRLMVYGLLLIVFVIFLPKGLAQLGETLARRQPGRPLEGPESAGQGK